MLLELADLEFDVLLILFLVFVLHWLNFFPVTEAIELKAEQWY